MKIIHSCCKYFPEIAETSLPELLHVVDELDSREALELDKDLPDS